MHHVYLLPEKVSLCHDHENTLNQKELQDNINFIITLTQSLYKYIKLTSYDIILNVNSKNFNILLPFVKSVAYLCCTFSSISALK